MAPKLCRKEVSMNISDLLGAMMQSGMSASSNQRLRKALGGGSDAGSLLEGLAGMLGGAGQQRGGVVGGAMSNRLGAGAGNLGGMLGNVLQSATRAAGGQQNLALGGLGALAGALLGGGGKSMGGALGGGVMALLGAMAFQALKGSGRPASTPLGLVEPRDAVERQALENQMELVLRAMINAAKADGRIDQGEVQRLVGKLEAMGADSDAQQWVAGHLQTPMETETLLGAAEGKPELAAEIYAASLMAIEVDTQAEKAYLSQLATGLGLPSGVTRRIEEMVGMRVA
jgi:uncharacterized membrane protein YebE (DUF533 family)